MLSSFTVLAKRTATKRAGGGKTNNKDSGGKHLGLKRHEGQYVEPNEVLYTQSGTKFFAGENTVTGRNFTINATEPGYVRFYQDPFHHKRRLIGVSLTKDGQLPKDHFAPYERRFGKFKLDPETKYGKKAINDLLVGTLRYIEHSRDVRTIHRNQENMRNRIAYYDNKKREFVELLKNNAVLESLWGKDFVESLSEEQTQFFTEFVYLMKNKFEYSHNIEAAFEYTVMEFKHSNNLRKKHESNPVDIHEKYSHVIPKYYEYLPLYDEALALKIKETVDFNKMDLNIIKKISESEKEAKKAKIIEEVTNIKPFLYTLNNANFKKIITTLDIKNADIKQVFSIEELQQLKDEIFVDVLPSSWEGVLVSKKEKDAVPMKLFDEETATFEDVLVSKFAFKDAYKAL